MFTFSFSFFVIFAYQYKTRLLDEVESLEAILMDDVKIVRNAE